MSTCRDCHGCFSCRCMKTTTLTWILRISEEKSGMVYLSLTCGDMSGVFDLFYVNCTGTNWFGGTPLNDGYIKNIYFSYNDGNEKLQSMIL